MRKFSIENLALMTSILVSALLATSSCAKLHINNSNKNSEKQIVELFQRMTGHFTSKEQAQTDSSFFDISLFMFPIWEDDDSAKWLYVEQSVSSMLDKPYRQRVYRLSHSNGTIESRVFTIPKPEEFIHAWEKPEIFDQLKPEELQIREGCSIYLKKSENGCYTGSTNEKDCKSTLRGASYATSTVSICRDQVVSWDQGWNEADEQVWGAVKGGYIFSKVDSFEF